LPNRTATTAGIFIALSGMAAAYPDSIQSAALRAPSESFPISTLSKNQAEPYRLGNNSTQPAGPHPDAKTRRAEEGLRAHPDYAGAWVSGDEIHVAFAKNKRTPSLQPPHPKIKFEVASYTFNELVSVQDSILAHMEDFRKKGIAILTTGIDPQYNYVYVGVQSGVQHAAEVFANDYGERVRVEASLPVSPADQGLDSSPYTAGSLIYTEAADMNHLCSSGPPINMYNQRFMLTAAHCIKLYGQAWIGASYKNAFIGRANWRHVRIDAAVVTGPAHSSAWMATYSWQYLPDAPYTALRNDNLCISGATTGTNCSGYVDKVNASAYYEVDPGVFTVQSGLTYLKSNSNFVGQGDSGGPAWIYSPSKSFAGMGVAFQKTGTCLGLYTGTVDCGNAAFVVPYQTLLSAFGGSWG